MKRWLGVVAFALSLTACAVHQEPVESRIVTMEVEPAAVLRQTLELLVEQGYVIELADTQLGRVDAELAAGAGYRLRWEIEKVERGSRVSVQGWRGRRPLAPYHLDPLLVELNSRLGLGP